MFDEAPEACTYRYLVDGEGEPQTLSNAEFDRRCRALAAHLRSRHAPGERALIVCPAGLDYVVSFFACLYAGVIAVPVYPPNPSLLKRTLPRLLAILDDAGASCVLAPAEITGMVDVFAEYAPRLRELDWVSVDTVDAAVADDWRHPATTAEDVAFLQYTSGSTSTPKGVVVGHANLLHNITRLNEQLFGAGDDDHMVTWLPPYHDMGLIAGLLAPAVRGYPVTFMSPFSFLKRPLRWLDALSRYRATIAGAPNFAFELCVAKTSEEERARLDLSSWNVAFNGAEPVRLSTLDRFSEAFAVSGFRRESFEPAYGLAEGTLAIAGSGGPRKGPVWLPVSARELSQHRIVTPEDDADHHVLVGCGRLMGDMEVVIVDPESREALPDGRVGEIWVHGPSVAQGYWQRPEQSEEIFHARIAGSGEGPYLRTGDLGYLEDGEVYVTGRIKDVIIVAGANYYPQDIERTIESVNPALRKGCGVAGTREIDGDDRILLIQEVGGNRSGLDLDGIMGEIRARVLAEHGLAVHRIALVGQGKVPKTSSGKLQRAACLDALVAGDLDPVAEWSQEAGSSVPAPQRSETQYDASGIARLLTAELATALKIEPAGLDHDAPFASLGLRSVELVAAIGRLEQDLGRSLPATLAYEHPTIARLAAFLAGDEAPVADVPGQPADQVAAVPADEPAERAIAIVGVGCRFPGGAHDPESFWALLREGTDAVTEVPAERWNVEDVFDPDPNAPGKTDARWGGFVPAVDRFDREFFRISQHEADRMDPQQRLLAEVTWEALEDAGVPAARIVGSRTGVFVGISSFDYANLALSDLTDVNAYTGTGSALSIAANRLSYLLDLRGPSMAVDTACSSSLVSVLQACAALRDGDCELALAGGVNLILSPAFAINFSKAGMMSPDGRCKSFDASANGFVRSEGVGMVVLKPLEAALSDGDTVYGLIRGGAINQDGRSNGINAPNPAAQEAVLRAAYADAGVSAENVDYIEAHGTGTMLGDPVEAKALGSVVGAGREAADPCVIGSVKSNVGHMEAAAGIGGLIKAALMLRHRHIPRTVHYREPNPHIPFAELGLTVADRDLPWPSEGRPGLVGVSSFGFGGTNAHVVLEQAPEPAERAERPRRSHHLVTLSADNAEALRELVVRYRDHAAGTDVPIAELAAATAVRRDHHAHRLACVVGSTDELAAHLADQLRGAETEAITGTPTARSRRTAFVFSGQGTRWWPLAADLFESEPVFRSALERCDHLLQTHVDWSLLRELSADPSASRLTEEAVRQPALCAVQIALATLWRSWGIEPAGVVGHSVGEVAAAHVAGALSLGDALRVAVHRGHSTTSAARSGRVAVVARGVEATKALLAARPSAALWFAGANSPHRSLVGGELAALKEFVAELTGSGEDARVLDSPEFASHTPMMEQAAAELWPELRGIRPRATAVPMYSTVFGEKVEGTRLDADYWTENLTRPVLFDQAITELAGDAFDTFVEIAPHPRLGDAVVERLEAEGTEGLVVSSLRRDTSGTASLLRALGTLYAGGLPVDFQRLYGGTVPHVALPGYAWQRQRCWLPAAGASRRARSDSGHPALQTYVHSAAEPGTVLWTSHVDAGEFGYLLDHVVMGTTVVPAAFLLDSALAAARRELGSGEVVLTDVRFDRPTILPERAAEPNLQLVLSAAGSGTGSLRLFSRDGAQADAPWTAVARGEYARGGLDPGIEALEAVRSRCRDTVDVPGQYATLRSAGLAYGPAFQGIATLARGQGEALATLRALGELTTGGAGGAGYGLHPALLDSGVQALVAAVGRNGGEEVHVPVGADRFTVTAGGAVARFVHAVVGASDARTGDITGCRVVFYDESGAPVAELSGLRLSRVDGSADDAAHDVLRVRWDPTPVDESAGELPPGWWLIFGSGAEATAVRTELQRRGATCVMVPAGTVEVANLEAVSTLLADLRDAQAQPCAGVVYAASLESAGLPEGAEAESARTVLVAVTDTLPEAPRFAVLTRDAQQVTPDDTVSGLAQSPLWGLVRVAMLEHGELRPVVIDLDPDEGVGHVDAAGQVVAELRREEDGQVALRGGQRYVPVLERWQRPAETERQWTRRPYDPGHHPEHRLLAERPGLLDSLVPAAMRRLEPGPGEVTVEVAAAGLNFSDVLKAMGLYPGAQGVVPLGAECSGRVSAVGPDVSGVSVGDEVMAVGPASLATSMTTDARLLVARPSALSDVDAAAVPVAFLTALYGLEYCARLRRGETVLIHSATGGVGLAALQIARRRGATVFATAGTEGKRALLRELGVEHVMDSRSLDFADEVAELTGGRGIDVVLNSVAGEGLVRGVEILAPGGRFVEIGKRDIYSGSRLGLDMLKRNRAFVAVDLEEMFREQRDLVAELFAEVNRGFADGQFTALPVTAFAYAHATEAFETMARARHTGKLVVRTSAVSEVAEAPVPGGVHGNGTYLVTGGLGALGLATARFLADHGARHLVLLGRGAPKERATAVLETLRERGVDVRVRSADVTVYDDVAAVVAEVTDTMPPLAGVVHAAGVVDDALLGDLDAERMRAVADPKVRGAWNLHRATAGHPVEMFVLYSSAAALLGSFGQGNYAAANAFLDALAQYRRAHGLPGLSVAWGPWAGDGMAARTGVGEAMAAKGIRELDPAEAVAALDVLVRTDSALACVLPLDLARLRERSADETVSPLLRQFADPAAGQGSPDSADGPSSDVRTALLAVEPGRRRRRVLIDHCVDTTARVLKIDTAVLDPTEPLAGAGIDSLLALELRKRLESSLGISIPPTFTWRFPTLEALVPFLAERMEIALDAEQAPPAGEPADAGETDGLDEDGLDELSEAELERLLLAKTRHLDEGLSR